MLNRGVLLQLNYTFCVFILTVAGTSCVQAQECGSVTPGRNVVPWHAGIFNKDVVSPSDPARFIWLCWGSLISNKIILTAAFWFWHGDVPAASLKMVVGLRNMIIDSKDVDLQMSDVLGVHVDPGYAKVRFKAHDIAVVIATDPFHFNDFVRPVCLNFDYDFELKQLLEGSKGKVYIKMDFRKVTPESINYLRQFFYRKPIWKNKHGLNAVGWAGPQLPKVVHEKELYYIPEDDCIDANIRNKLLSVNFHRDKFCVVARDANSSLYVQDIGVGIAFPTTVNGVERYYLRGIFSKRISDNIGHRKCVFIHNTYYGFTVVLLYENFIKKYWNGNDTLDEIPKQIGKCHLPLNPEHGSFAINVTHTNISGGEDFVLVSLTLTCQPGYGVVGVGTVHCYNGFWPDSPPTCIRMCQLKPHPSVEYRCPVSGDVVGSRECGRHEPVGAIVSPRCRQPHYYSASTLPFMKCNDDGNWDYIAKCVPECGRITPGGKVLVVGGKRIRKGEVPWHAGIYTKTTSPYLQICGGSIISNNVIISAAHCFWTDLEKQLPADRFAVAVGKIYRPWNDAVDEAQKSDVKRIHLPTRYQGSGASFQDDIAVVVVSDPIQYKTFVRPVCLNFDYNFDRLQLQTINKGKVAGWGLTAADGKPSPVLCAVDLPYVEVGTCLANSPPDFREYITSDKICAGTQDSGSALCKGDSGGGLAFPTADHGTERYYLRGVVSTAPNDDHACNAHTYTSFTQIIKHEDFIKPFLTEA